MCLFMERFENIALNIQKLIPDVTLHHTVMILRLRLFVDNLCKKLVVDLDELRRTAAKFM